MNALGRRDHPMREAHTPRQAGGNAVVAVAAQETTDTANRIADSCRRRAGIEEGERGNFFAVSQNKERRKSTQKAAKPRKTEAARQQRPGIGEKLPRRLQDVIEPRPDDSRETRYSDYQERVGANPSA